MPPYLLSFIFIGKTSQMQYGDEVFACLIVCAPAGKFILYDTSDTPTEHVIDPPDDHPPS